MSEPPLNQANVISTRLMPVIAAAADRIHYAEARRANYSVMAGALIAAGITILTFAFGAFGMQWMRIGAAAGSLSMIVVGAVILYVFGQQTNRYPFTAATNTWKWFYRDALPDQTAFDLKPWQSWSSQKTFVQQAYEDQLPKFKGEMLKLIDDNTDLDQDVQQAYVLHINEKYKNLYLNQLRYLFNRGLIFIAVLTLVGGVAGALWEVSSHKTISSSSSNGEWTQKIGYRLVSSQLSETAEWVVKVTTTNNLDQPLTFRRLRVLDAEGWPLPVEITYAAAFPHLVKPGQTDVVFATVKSSGAVWDAVASVELEIQ